jgi:hypothetical protein
LIGRYQRHFEAGGILIRQASSCAVVDDAEQSW